MHQPALCDTALAGRTWEFEPGDQGIELCCVSSGRDTDNKSAFDVQGTVTPLVLEAAVANLQTVLFRGDRETLLKRCWQNNLNWWNIKVGLAFTQPHPVCPCGMCYSLSYLLISNRNKQTVMLSLWVLIGREWAASHSFLFRSQTWLQIRFMMNWPWVWVSFTISAPIVKRVTVYEKAGPQWVLKGNIKLKQGLQEFVLFQKRYYHTSDITNHIKWRQRATAPRAWGFYSSQEFRKKTHLNEKLYSEGH